jgi:hypothetical protein
MSATRALAITTAALTAALPWAVLSASAGAVAESGTAHAMVGLTGRGIALTRFQASTRRSGGRIAVSLRFAGRAISSPKSFDLDAYTCSNSPELPKTCHPSATRGVRFTSTATARTITLSVPVPKPSIDAVHVRLDVPKPSFFTAAEIVLPARAWTQYAGRAFGVTATQSGGVTVTAMRADAEDEAPNIQKPAPMALVLAWTASGPPASLATTSWLACPTCAPDVRTQPLSAAGAGAYSPFQREIKPGAVPLWTTSLTIGTTTAYSVTLPYAGRQ